jgi:hypothetical protein
MNTSYLARFFIIIIRVKWGKKGAMRAVFQDEIHSRIMGYYWKNQIYDFAKI